MNKAEKWILSLQDLGKQYPQVPWLDGAISFHLAGLSHHILNDSLTDDAFQGFVRDVRRTIVKAMADLSKDDNDLPDDLRLRCKQVLDACRDAAWLGQRDIDLANHHLDELETPLRDALKIAKQSKQLRSAMAKLVGGKA